MVDRDLRRASGVLLFDVPGVGEVSNAIFVFGSNLAGRPGKGAARDARLWYGAIYGQGVGLSGQSYAIPPRDEQIRTLPLDIIRRHVDDFIAFAVSRPDLEFLVTRIGCGH